MADSKNSIADNLTVVQDFFIAVHCSEQNSPHVLDAVVEIDLAEFELTQAELSKLTRLLRSMNNKIMDALAQVCPAVSLNTEIRTRKH